MIGKRRSLTIREENDKRIQHIRSQFLYSNIDIDYTTMANICIELGDMVLRLGTCDITNIINIFKKYLEDIDDDTILRIWKDYQNKYNCADI